MDNLVEAKQLAASVAKTALQASVDSLQRGILMSKLCRHCGASHRKHCDQHTRYQHVVSACHGGGKQSKAQPSSALRLARWPCSFVFAASTV